MILKLVTATAAALALSTPVPADAAPTPIVVTLEQIEDDLNPRDDDDVRVDVLFYRHRVKKCTSLDGALSPRRETVVLTLTGQTKTGYLCRGIDVDTVVL